MSQPLEHENSVTEDAISLARNGQHEEALNKLRSVANNIDTYVAQQSQVLLTREFQNLDAKISHAAPYGRPKVTNEKELNALKYGAAKAHYNVAVAAYEARKFDEALYQANETINILGGLMPIMLFGLVNLELIFRSQLANLMGRILVEYSSLNRAIMYFDESIKLLKSYSYSDTLVAALNNKGICHAEMGENVSALRSIQKAIEMGKTQIKTHIDAGTIPDAELHNLRRAILNKAFIYFIMNYKEEAYDSISNELNELLIKMARQSVSMGAKFNGWLTSLLTFLQPSSRDLYIIALILYTKKRKEEALAVLDEAISLDKSSNPFIWYQKGNILLKQKEYEEAVRCYSRAIEIKPSMAEAHNNSAVALGYIKNYDDSRKEIVQAIRTNPSLPTAHENLIKLTMNDRGQSQDVWKYWGASGSKKAIAATLSLLAAALVIFPIITPFMNNGPPSEESELVTTKNIKNITGSKSSTTEELTSTTNKSLVKGDSEAKIPESYLVVVALIVLIILLPQLKSLKAGPVEFELQTKESVEIDTTLRPVEDGFISEDAFIPLEK